MPRIRAIIDFDVSCTDSTQANLLRHMYIMSPINNMLHKLVRPENLEQNKILYATVHYELKNDRFLFTQNDPEESP